MTRLARLETIAKAKLLFYYHGRGCILHLRDRVADDEDRYSSIGEIREALAEETDAKALDAAAMWAVCTYDPITQPHLRQSRLLG